MFQCVPKSTYSTNYLGRTTIQLNKTNFKKLRFKNTTSCIISVKKSLNVDAQSSIIRSGNLEPTVTYTKPLTTTWVTNPPTRTYYTNSQPTIQPTKTFYSDPTTSYVTTTYYQNPTSTYTNYVQNKIPRSTFIMKNQNPTTTFVTTNQNPTSTFVTTNQNPTSTFVTTNQNPTSTFVTTNQNPTSTFVTTNQNPTIINTYIKSSVPQPTVETSVVRFGSTRSTRNIGEETSCQDSIYLQVSTLIF